MWKPAGWGDEIAEFMRKAAVDKAAAALQASAKAAEEAEEQRTQAAGQDLPMPDQAEAEAKSNTKWATEWSNIMLDDPLVKNELHTLVAGEERDKRIAEMQAEHRAKRSRVGPG